MYSALNPIRSVNGRQVPVPSTYEWELEDVSASDAGRTEDARMHKKRIRQAIKIKVTWDNVNTIESSEILKTFNPEYMQIVCLDPWKGGYVEKEFYIGNRSAPLLNGRTGTWNISFNIIER